MQQGSLKHHETICRSFLEQKMFYAYGKADTQTPTFLTFFLKNKQMMIFIKIYLFINFFFPLNRN